METTQRIEFRRKRDFGEIFSATFSFLRQNAKPMFKALLTIVGPIYLVGSLVILYLSKSVLQNGVNGFQFNGNYFLLVFASITILAIGSSSQFATIIAYFKLYLDYRPGDEEISVSAVWEKAKSLIFPLIGLSFLVAIVCFLGAIFCLLPGIYLAVALSFSFYILGMEGKDISDSFSRSFSLIAGHWWITFGIAFVIGIIAFLISLVFSLPLQVINTILGMNSLGNDFIEVSASSKSILQYITWIYTPIVYLAQMLLRTIPMIAICLQYFSVVEEKEAIGMMEQIEEIDQLDQNQPI